MTTDTDLPLAAGFEANDKTRWRAAIEKILKGGDFARLNSKTADGIALEPLYGPASGRSPVPSSHAGRPWQIVQRVDHPDAAAANRLALDDLENGANGLVLVFAESATARGYGIASADPATLEALFDDIALDMITLRLEAGGGGMRCAEAIAGLAEARGHAGASLAIDFGLAPIASLATGGTHAADWQTTASAHASLIRDLTQRGFSGPYFAADARPVSEAGGSEAQELAFAIASAVAYLRALEGGGTALSDAANAISFTLAIDAGQFEGLAKLRALRKLWARILTAAGLDSSSPAALHAETAWRMATRRDTGVNMLRATMATFVAGIGGADSLTVLPHSLARGLPDGFARRIARNTQNVLIEESNLWRVADPAAGSGAIETLTDQFCQTAWALFQEIEREGGIIASLEAGALQARIAAVAEDRSKRLAQRQDPITGTSEFPQLDEPATGVLDVAPQPRSAVTGGAIVVVPLAASRLAEPFETLRDAADAATARTGQRPAVFLANLGPMAEHTARATWVRNLFAVGGIGSVGTDGTGGTGGFTQSGDVARAFAQSGATIACLCSSDATYETLGEATAMALRGAGASHVLLAGKPGANANLLKAAGVDTFLHVGIDVLATLHGLQAQLGIA